MKSYRFFILVLFVLQSSIIYSQDNKKGEMQSKRYIEGLKENGIDTFLVVEQRKYNYQSEIDIRVLYVITKAQNKYVIQKFDNNENYPPAIVDTLRIFNLIEQRKAYFKEKDAYFEIKEKQKKKIWFLPPKPVHTYIAISIDYPDFKNSFEITDEEFNGGKISNLPWFKPLKFILDEAQVVLNIKE